MPAVTRDGDATTTGHGCNYNDCNWTINRCFL